MPNFDDLKNAYVSVVQWGLSVGVSYEESMRGNEVLHKCCETFIDNSNHTASDRTTMKLELEIIKGALSREINSFFLKSKI